MRFLRYFFLFVVAKVFAKMYLNASCRNTSFCLTRFPNTNKDKTNKLKRKNKQTFWRINKQTNLHERKSRHFSSPLLSQCQFVIENKFYGNSQNSEQNSLNI